MKIKMQFTVSSKHGMLKRGSEYELNDADYVENLIKKGDAVEVTAKKPKENKAAKPKHNKSKD